MVILKRKREQFEQEELFYGHGRKWFRGPLISEGSSSVTFLATLKKPKTRGWPQGPFPIRMAVKSSRNWLAHSKESENFIMLKGCSYICEYFGKEITFADHENKTIPVYNLLLEYASGGNLYDLIKKSGPGGLPEAAVRHYMRCVVKGIYHVHRHGYVLNGLKSENILLYPSTTSIGHMFIAKIGELESAEKVRKMHRNESAVGIFSSEPVNNSVPELALDIRDLGCVLLEMLLGKSFSVGNQDLKIYEGWKTLEVSKNISEDAKDFVKRCLVKQSPERLTADMLLKHPFLSESQIDEEPEEWKHETEQFKRAYPTCPESLDYIPLELEASEKYENELYKHVEPTCPESLDYIPLEKEASGKDENEPYMHTDLPDPESLEHMPLEEEAPEEEISDQFSSVETKSSSSVEDWNFISLEVTSSGSVPETMLDLPSPCFEVDDKHHSPPCLKSLDYIPLEVEASEQVSDHSTARETKDCSKLSCSVDRWNFIPLEVNGS